ncbi:N-acetyltransferase [Flavimobilis marinus]|uniref:Phosphinothricin acetyltransferase n=1 Tax=Flavimobilis marinus TaxID=285351 RepID=A0A1I2I0G8_9MICO|nr:GNAT family N-acetyltransferase [Flavimobilis marinus]GHG48497.1 N-acetyltransferase [Flavimobilis marinus]SFF35849.1 phosphinothricin acetyltransferase [Flavimobilis marinus]
MTIRPAAPADMPGVARIFAHYVTTSTATFELTPPTAEAWTEKLAAIAGAGWPFLVVTDDGAPSDGVPSAPPEAVVGFSYVSAWRPRPAYDQTVEDTIYLAPDAVGRGLGARLLARLLDDAAAAGAREVVAVIADADSTASLALHRRAGFTEAGRLERVGHKFDRWLGTTLLQRSVR